MKDTDGKTSWTSSWEYSPLAWEYSSLLAVFAGWQSLSYFYVFWQPRVSLLESGRPNNVSAVFTNSKVRIPLISTYKFLSAASEYILWSVRRSLNFQVFLTTCSSLQVAPFLKATKYVLLAVYIPIYITGFRFLFFLNSVVFLLLSDIFQQSLHLRW